VKRILVGYDGSAGGQRALERAIEEAEKTRSRITVVSVLNVPLDPDGPRNFGTLDDISEHEGEALSPPPNVVEQLTDARERLAKAGVDADLVWGAGPAGDVIVDTATRLHADVIVVGEHHHGFLSRAFGGDVGADVQREAGCEVILA
jgi:nucleotide-binding universal stress UspA family protein